MSEIKSKIKKSMVISFLLIGFVVGLVMISNMNPTEIIQSIGQRGWKTFATADGPHAPGTCAFLMFGTITHSATPATTYATNISNSSFFEFRDFLNGEMDGETPWGVAFDFALKFVVNTTVGYNTSGSKWMDSWVRANLTCNFDFITDIGPLAAMTIVQIENNTNYAWYYAYMNNGGSGYTITKNEKFNCTAIVGQGYW